MAVSEGVPEQHTNTAQIIDKMLQDSGGGGVCYDEWSAPVPILKYWIEVDGAGMMGWVHHEATLETVKRAVRHTINLFYSGPFAPAKP